MKSSDECACDQLIVSGKEVRISLVELGPPKGRMSTGVEHHGSCCNWRSTEEVGNMIGAIIFYVEIKLLQVCGLICMVGILQFSLCFHELQRLVMSVDDCLLPKNVIIPLETGL